MPTLPIDNRFLRHLAPVRKKRWVVYAKPPFAGPEAVLAYLARYTHRVAISNRRLIAFHEAGVTFRYKDYRRNGPERQQAMTLDTHEFMRRFLLHVLPRGFPPLTALRAARQRHAQGQHRPRPRAVGRAAAIRTGRADRSARSDTALSLLRRAHAHHRDLRTLEPTTCAAQSPVANRDDAVRDPARPAVFSHTAAPALRSPTRRPCCTPDRAIPTYSDRRPSVLRSQPAEYLAIQIKLGCSEPPPDRPPERA